MASKPALVAKKLSHQHHRPTGLQHRRHGDHRVALAQVNDVAARHPAPDVEEQRVAVAVIHRQAHKFRAQHPQHIARLVIGQQCAFAGSPALALVIAVTEQQSVGQVGHARTHAVAHAREHGAQDVVLQHLVGLVGGNARQHRRGPVLEGEKRPGRAPHRVDPRRADVVIEEGLARKLARGLVGQAVAARLDEGREPENLILRAVHLHHLERHPLWRAQHAVVPSRSQRLPDLAVLQQVDHLRGGDVGRHAALALDLAAQFFEQRPEQLLAHLGVVELARIAAVELSCRACRRMMVTIRLRMACSLVTEAVQTCRRVTAPAR